MGVAKNSCLLALLILAVHFGRLWGVAVTIHFMSTIPPDLPRVAVSLNDDKSPYGGWTELIPGIQFQINLDVSENYPLLAASPAQLVQFQAYDPRRDEGKADVYWRLSVQGLDIGYDNRTWKREISWKYLYH